MFNRIDLNFFQVKFSFLSLSNLFIANNDFQQIVHTPKYITSKYGGKQFVISDITNQTFNGQRCCFYKTIKNMKAIHWPKEFTPGFTDNFVSAETYVAGLTAEEVFPYLTHAHIWADYYDGVSDMKLTGSDGKPELKEGTRFSFNIIGWDVTAEVVEFVEPSKERPGRLSWHGWVPGDENTRFDALHGFLFENMPDGRVRILTQESEIGKPAAELAKSHSASLLVGFQAWLDGMVDFARKKVRLD